LQEFVIISKNWGHSILSRRIVILKKGEVYMSSEGKCQVMSKPCTLMLKLDKLSLHQSKSV